MTTIQLPFEKRTVFDGRGGGDLGQVTTAIADVIGCRVGPIRLLNGVQGRTGGFGLAHLEFHANRMKQIKGLGFRDARTYVGFIAQDFEAIAAQAHQHRLMFLRERNGITHRLVSQWDEELEIWSVTTAIPKTGISGLNIVWRK